MNRNQNPADDAAVNAEKVRIKVIPTEVYSRVVGYYRPIQNWNKGKAEEFSERNMIDPNSPVISG